MIEMSMINQIASNVYFTVNHSKSLFLLFFVLFLDDKYKMKR